VDYTSGESGWNLTLGGNTAAGKSARFKQYCENGAAKCGATEARSYVSGGHELAVGSLQLKTSGASWTTTGGAGSAPTFQCGATTCSVDSSTQSKIVSAAAKAALGPWSASGFGANSLTLTAPSTLYSLPEHELYHLDLLWTLSSGP
jgi:hypothetical protein